MNTNKKLSNAQRDELLVVLKSRFEKNMNRHNELKWNEVLEKMKKNPDKLWSLNEMERTGGEPDVVDYDKDSGEYLFYDCAVESPAGRRSVCYDQQALDSRKKYKPANSAVGMASEMGVELLDEEQYRKLQTLGNFDTKTSSWLKSPDDIRERGGAIFGDYRYGHVFIYHNGAESYYAARGFRCLLRV
jgi:hypothetical protein